MERSIPVPSGAPAVGPPVRPDLAYRAAMRRDQIALQLFTVRALLAADLTTGLRAVASAGYRSVELAGVGDVPADRLARALDDAGLRVIAAHEPIERLRDDAAGVVRRLRTVGCDRIVVPAMPAEDRAAADDVRRFTRELAGLAARLADEGVRLAYHNHDYEFTRLEGTRPWDILLDGLPERVELELDVYWVSVAGLDPVALTRSAAGRLRLLHVKDRAPGPEPRDAVPGEGTLPIAEIVEAGRTAGVEWYVAELVDGSDPLGGAAAAARYLATLAR